MRWLAEKKDSFITNFVMKKKPFTILLALNTTKHAKKALDYCIKQCTRLQSYKLHIVNIVALNPKSQIPFVADQ
jgi:hypothetical protein